jgi:hypothetical protein
VEFCLISIPRDVRDSTILHTSHRCVASHMTRCPSYTRTGNEILVRFGGQYPTHMRSLCYMSYFSKSAFYLCRNQMRNYEDASLNTCCSGCAKLYDNPYTCGFVDFQETALLHRYFYTSNLNRSGFIRCACFMLRLCLIQFY